MVICYIIQAMPQNIFLTSLKNNDLGLIIVFHVISEFIVFLVQDIWNIFSLTIYNNVLWPNFETFFAKQQLRFSMLRIFWINKINLLAFLLYYHTISSWKLVVYFSSFFHPFCYFAQLSTFSFPAQYLSKL